MTDTTVPALVSGAIFIGDDNSDPHAQPVDVFKNPTNHITALSSILAHFAKKTSFYPHRHQRQQQKPQEESPIIPAYDAFIKDAISFSSFNETNFKETKALPIDGSLFQFEQAIREFLQG
ncbi:hypothetical protein BGX27_002729, partial [Mortierella sp. AM989]